MGLELLDGPRGGLTVAPVVLDPVGELLSVTCRTCRVDSDDKVSLRSPGSRVPACRPRVLPSTLGTTVDEESWIVRLIYRKHSPIGHFFLSPSFHPGGLMIQAMTLRSSTPQNHISSPALRRPAMCSDAQSVIW